MTERGQTGAGKRVRAPARSVAGACGRPSEGRAWAAVGTAARGGAGGREAEEGRGIADEQQQSRPRSKGGHNPRRRRARDASGDLGGRGEGARGRAVAATGRDHAEEIGRAHV